MLDPPGLIQRARQQAAATPDSADRTSAPDASPSRRILVVDDALTVRELQRSILERAGFAVRVACDGIEALALLAEEPSDLVLTDIEMPRMDGFALTEAIRAHPTLTNIPILILTSRSSDTDRQRGLDAGADGYIIKSAFDEAGLLSAIDRLLGRRAMTRRPPISVVVVEDDTEQRASFCTPSPKTTVNLAVRGLARRPRPTH